jgi:uncharacterized protein (TIGR00725 family)
LKEGKRHTVTVFGSSRPGEGEPDYQLAYELGAELARAGFTICNGGYGGIMQASAHGAKNAGGTTIGILAGFFPRKANPWMDSTFTAGTLVERMMELVSRGDAYVILKGGTGTLLEFAAVWEFMNKSVIREKPIVLVGRFWNGVVETLKQELAWEGLEDCTRYVTIVDSPMACASYLKQQLTGAGDET